MPQYDNNNSGLFFQTKSKNPKAPKMSGFIEVSEPGRYDIAGWVCKSKQGEVRKDKNGNWYFQLKLSPSEEQPAPTPPPVPAEDDLWGGDEPPF